MKPLTFEGVVALWEYGLRVGVLVLGALAPSAAAVLTWRYRWELLGYPMAALARFARWALRRRPHRLVRPKPQHEVPSRVR